MQSNKEKTHHSTAFNTSALSLPTSQCVCLLSLLCPGACVFIPLNVLSDANRQLLKASMKYQHAAVCGPGIITQHSHVHISKESINIHCMLKAPYSAHVQVPISVLCLYCDVFPCFNVQKGPTKTL